MRGLLQRTYICRCNNAFKFVSKNENYLEKPLDCYKCGKRMIEKVLILEVDYVPGSGDPFNLGEPNDKRNSSSL